MFAGKLKDSTYVKYQDSIRKVCLLLEFINIRMHTYIVVQSLDIKLIE